MPAFKWFLIFLIPLTLGWKLVATRPGVHETHEHIVRFLKAHDFNVREEIPLKGVPIVRATRGDCNMIAAEAAPDGSTSGIIHRVATGMDQQFVVFRGNIYQDQPTWLTVTDDRWTGYLRRLGIARFEPAPIMIAAAAACVADRLPWAELVGTG
jgi:hypothetical protein